MNQRLYILIFLISFGCASRFGNLYPPGSSEINIEKIYIAKHNWHTGIIFNREAANPYMPALKDDFQNAFYLEVGWGDLDFYTAEKGTLGLGIKAIAWPSKSALHVRPYETHPFWIFDENEIVELTISNEGFMQLMQYINKSFALDSNSYRIIVNRENTRIGQFYLSNEKYHMFKTCNVWTAKALKKTGFPIISFNALTSKNVMSQLKRKK